MPSSESFCPLKERRTSALQRRPKECVWPGVPEEQRIPVGPSEGFLLFGWHLGAKPRGDRATLRAGRGLLAPGRRSQQGGAPGTRTQRPAASRQRAAPGGRLPTPREMRTRAVPSRSRGWRRRGAPTQSQRVGQAAGALRAGPIPTHFSAPGRRLRAPRISPRGGGGTRVAAPRSRRQAHPTRGAHRARTVPLPAWRGAEKTPARGAPLRPRRSPSEDWRLPAAREARTFLLGRRWLVRETKETWAGPGERRAR